MNIRTRLALQFLLLASCILGVAFVVVYLRAADFRHVEFMTRLHDRGENAAKLLIQVDEIDDRLLRKMERISPIRLPEEAISIFDGNDSMLFHLGADHQLPLTALVERTRRDGSSSLTGHEREFFGSVLQDGPDRFVVITSAYDRYGRRKLTDQAKVMLATFLVGLVLIFLIGRAFARRALSPVQRLVSDLQLIRATDMSNRVDIGNGKDELGQLAASFNALLGRLQAAFTSQRNFIANASHEMRTPLTVISGQIDVLLLKPRSEAEYLTALRSVQEDLHAVNRMSDRLLMMAQAETEATSLTFTPERMDELIWAARTEVMRASDKNRVSVVIEPFDDEADLTVNGNGTLLRSMLLNLMENACKYSPDHCATVTLQGSGALLQLMVDDNGPGIAPEDQERIFEHFVRSDNTGGASGHGIGLALVKRIVELHRGSVHVRSSLGQGACFTVRIPKAR